MEFTYTSCKLSHIKTTGMTGGWDGEPGMVMMAEAPAMARGLENRKESFTYDAEIERDRKALLLKSVRSTTAATIGAAFIVLIHFWPLVGHIPLILWSALTIAVGVFRFAVVRQAGDS